jgi:hypothetical protein
MHTFEYCMEGGDNLKKDMIFASWKGHMRSAVADDMDRGDVTKVPIKPQPAQALRTIWAWRGG